MLARICRSAAMETAIKGVIAPLDRQLVVRKLPHNQHRRNKMNINEKEDLAAERVSQTAYGQVMIYTKNPDDIEAAHLGLLWAAFVSVAKSQGLKHWRDIPLDEC
jgi:hypothetical protein